jgi:hemolysin type calcium-binding protein
VASYPGPGERPRLRAADTCLPSHNPRRSKHGQPEGTFSYFGETKPGPVYPSGQVTRGMPVFTRLVDTLAVSFAYRLRTSEQADVHGTIALEAVVRDTTGWERVLRIARTHAFTGPTAWRRGPLDVAAFETLVRDAREQTAAPLAGFGVEFRPRVEVGGAVGATDVGDARTMAALGIVVDDGIAGNDRIVTGGKSDCILGGAGNDDINAGGGFDMCIGGPGVDTFKNCEVVFQ